MSVIDHDHPSWDTGSDPTVGDDWSDDWTGWGQDQPDDWTEDWTESGSDDPSDDLIIGVRAVLHEDYESFDDDHLGETLDHVLADLSPAESFSFANALRQAGAGVTSVLANPTVVRTVQAGLPIGAGAVGAVVGGPAGAAVASRLGAAAAGSLGSPSAPRSPTPPGIARTSVATVPTVATVATAPTLGAPSNAAAQAAVALQQPTVQQAVLSAALGASGRRTVNGVPVSDVLTMLSSIFGQAAAEADELRYADSDGADSLLDDDVDDPGRSLYTALVEAADADLVDEGC